MKIVINKKIGYFELSDAVMSELNISKRNGKGHAKNSDFNINSSNLWKYRANNRLINAIEKIGEEASSTMTSELRIINVPANTVWRMYEWMGLESIHGPNSHWK